MMYGSVTAKSYFFSNHNDRYRPRWRENNFPGKDYFGRPTLDSIKAFNEKD